MDVPADARVHLQLLDWWELRIEGRPVAVGNREQRLLALLALAGRRSRLQVAATLWPDSTEHHATSNLRAALWHVRRVDPEVLLADRTTLALAPAVCVDVHAVRALTERASADPTGCEVAQLRSLCEGDVLPGWYEDWVLFERERLQHARVRALATAAEALWEAERPGHAAAAARAALQVEPLLEAVNVLLVRALLAAGEMVEAVRHFKVYRERLAQDLGIGPSPRLVELVRPLMLPRPRDAAGDLSGRAGSPAGRGR